MNLRRAFRAVRESDAGGSLPAVLIGIAVGAILLTPFLAHVSSRMLATRATEENTDEYYGADSGIEFAIWHLDSNHDGYRDDVEAGASGSLNLEINGVPVEVESTALPLGAWIEMADTPAPVDAGGSLTRISNSLFALRGGATRGFWRYDIADNSWIARASTPEDVGAGGDLTTRDGDTIFALRGDGRDDFWRYQPSSNTWSELEETEAPVEEAGSISYVDSDHSFAFLSPSICVPPFNPSFCLDFIWRYDESEDEWDQRALNPAGTGAGADLSPDGTGNLLALRGGGTNDFWRYDPNDDAWSTAPQDPSTNAGEGAALSSDGVEFVYALFGGGSSVFRRYNVAGDFWQDLASTPQPVGGGGGLTYYSESNVLFALRGNGTRDFWMFDPARRRYDISAEAGDTTIIARVELAFDASNNVEEISIIFWDIQ